MSNGNNGAPLSLEQFAAYLERRLVLHDDEVEVVGRQGATLLLRVRGSDITPDLRRAYAAYTRDPTQLDAVARSWVRLLLGEVPPRDERDFASLAARVMPMLKPIEVLAVVAERKVPMIAYRDFPANLIISYVIDEQRSVAYISEEQLEDWGLTIQELHETAMTNLRRRTAADVRFTTVGEGEQRLYIFSSGDGYDATRLLLTDMLSEWAHSLTGRLVVGIPNRDFLIAFGDANQDIVQSVAAQVQADAAQREHGLTDQLFTLTSGAISEYQWE